MLPSRDIPQLERPDYFDGQRLAAADLDAAVAFHRELRWLHNRFHGWGVAWGYGLEGEREARSVTVAPGVALDCAGRELLLSEPVSGSVPPVPGAVAGGPARFDLVVSYAEDDELTPELRGGVCESAGAVRRPDRPMLRWTKPDERIPGIDVVLGSIEVEQCRLARPASQAGREPLVDAGPYVASGRTASGATTWRHWPAAQPVGVMTTVPTGSSGFRGRPTYLAQVTGNRDFETGGTWYAVDGHAHVAQVTATSFDLRVVLPGPLATGPAGRELNPDEVREQAFAARLRDDLGWYVTWIGIEG